MAVGYRNAQVATGSSGTTITVTKPTGLAVGDFMLLLYRGQTNNTPTLPSVVSSGWTVHSASTPNNVLRFLIASKVANAGDVAASGFTISPGGTNTNGHLVCIAMTGVDPTNPIYEIVSDGGDAASPLVYGDVDILNADGGLVGIGWTANHNAAIATPTNYVEVIDLGNINNSVGLRTQCVYRTPVAAGTYGATASTGTGLFYDITAHIGLRAYVPINRPALAHDYRRRRN